MTTPNSAAGAAFARRFESACENNPHVPSFNAGRLTWIRDQMKKRGMAVSIESISKWYSGFMMPRREKLALLAEILGVDEAWLAVGQQDAPIKERKARNATADGMVNAIAGFLQMDGGHPAFPQDDKNPDVDLYAIIRGANYAFHVAAGEDAKGGSVKFMVPQDFANLFVIGAVRREGDMAIDLYELPSEFIGSTGTNRTGMIEVITVPSKTLKRIESFANRL